MRDFFGSMFGQSRRDRRPEQENLGQPAPEPRRNLDDQQPPPIGYKKGDLIGQKYEVCGMLGKGGFGVVYLVHSRETKSAYALKTFRDEYLNDAQARERFRKEAQSWVDLERHPYLVRAHIVEELASRLYMAMEYVAPNEDGLNSLEGYLLRRPPNLAQTLRWAIQFCHGMEYAYSRGIRCHRDIKPANILISQDRVVKIADFGLADSLGSAAGASEARVSVQDGRVGLSMQTMEGAGFGTPTHMPPEQFTNAAACDQRSDIYSFGIVLYQMATGGQLPFLAPMPRDESREEMMRFWKEMDLLHRRAVIPELKSPVFPMIDRCLEKYPNNRFGSFIELRLALEPILKRETGEVLAPPSLEEPASWEWSNRAVSLGNLGCLEESILNCEKAIQMNPLDPTPRVNKATSLMKLGRLEEALYCLDAALGIDKELAVVWVNKANCLARLGRFEEALRSCDQALDRDHQDARAWSLKGSILMNFGRYDESLRCCSRALAIDPSIERAWWGKGMSLAALGHHDEAIHCFDKAVAIDPGLRQVWFERGSVLGKLGRFDEAIACFDKCLELDSRDVRSLHNKGHILDQLGRLGDAIRCYDDAIAIDSRQANIWNNKGNTLNSLGRFEEALHCCHAALVIDPKMASAWNNKAIALANLGHLEEALSCLTKAVELEPDYPTAWYNKALMEEDLGRLTDSVNSYRQLMTFGSQARRDEMDFARQRLRELERR